MTDLCRVSIEEEAHDRKMSQPSDEPDRQAVLELAQRFLDVKVDYLNINNRKYTIMELFDDLPNDEKYHDAMIGVTFGLPDVLQGLIRDKARFMAAFSLYGLDYANQEFKS